MTPKIKLRDKDLNKLSGITQISVETLKKLESMNLLDEIEVRNLLILTDWRKLKLKQDKKYTTAQIVGAIVNEYQVSTSKVENIIYEKKKSMYWCKLCEKRISKGEYQRNDGVCDKCVTQSIKL